MNIGPKSAAMSHRARTTTSIIQHCAKSKTVAVHTTQPPPLISSVVSMHWLHHNRKRMSIHLRVYPNQVTGVKDVASEQASKADQAILSDRKPNSHRNQALIKRKALINEKKKQEKSTDKKKRSKKSNRKSTSDPKGSRAYKSDEKQKQRNLKSLEQLNACTAMFNERLVTVNDQLELIKQRENLLLQKIISNQNVNKNLNKQSKWPFESYQFCFTLKTLHQYKFLLPTALVGLEIDGQI